MKPFRAPARLAALQRHPQLAGHLVSPAIRLGLAALALLALAACASVSPPGEPPAGVAGPHAAGAVAAGATAAAAAPRAPGGSAGGVNAATATATAPADAPSTAAPGARALLPEPRPVAVPPPGEGPGVDTLDDLPPPPRDLWDRIKAGRGIPELHDNWVEQREAYYSARPDYVARMVSRGGRYLFHIVEEVEKRGLPTELALLPFIESAFNPQAISSAQAAGMWQFIPSTGKYFDLKQNLFRDDRRSVVASTQAALDYLTRLHGMFKDWHLALAAYNWGEGNVQRAIERNRRAGLPTDYANLRMPRETRDYVPKLQAIENILADPARYGLSVASLPNEAVFRSVAIERDIDVALAARLAGIGVDEFKALNPQMNKPVILAAGTPVILLPHDNALLFAARLGQHDGPLASWTAWTAPSTMKVSEAAERVGMTEAALREANRIPPRMQVRAGSTLLVARAAHKETDVPEHIADNAMLALAPDAPARRRVQVKARSGDTLASFARRHRVSAEEVAHWNRLGPQARLQAGQTLVVMTVAAPAAAPRRTAAAPARRVAAAPAARASAPAPAARTKPRSQASARAPAPQTRVAQR